MNNYTLLLDTETVNKSKGKSFTQYGNMVFDIGFLIIDGDFNVVHSYQALNSDIFNDDSYMENLFFGKEKLDWYINSDIPRKTTHEIALDFKEIFDTYSIERIAAYNISFDKRAIKSTEDEFIERWIDFDKYEVIDLYHMACQALEGNENYVISSMENGKVSDKGNVSSNAESVYCFIKNDYSFVEDHTALSDCYIEYEIYEWIVQEEKKRNVKFLTSSKPSCWRLVQRKKG